MALSLWVCDKMFRQRSKVEFAEVVVVWRWEWWVDVSSAESYKKMGWKKFSFYSFGKATYEGGCALAAEDYAFYAAAAGIDDCEVGGYVRI